MPDQSQNNGQRSKEWFLKRHKRWTASVISKLMSEGAKVPKNAGGDGEMKWKWGDAAKTQLFSKFYQRLTDVVEKETFQSFEMERGLELEPMSIARFGDLYLDYYIQDSADLVDTGLVLFPDDDGTLEWQQGYKGENDSAGASPDGIVSIAIKDTTEFQTIEREEADLPPLDKVRNERLEIFATIETKARGEEATHSHAYAPFDEKHKDFYQVMAQMHACGVNKSFYLSYDDEKPAPWDLQVKEVPISPLHVRKMRTKIKDADSLIDGYLERCKGIEAMMPHEANVLLTSIRNDIQALKEKW